jgi:hypothetical protein
MDNIEMDLREKVSNGFTLSLAGRLSIKLTKICGMDWIDLA